MILYIDIGNTNVVSAVWDGSKFYKKTRIDSYSNSDDIFVTLSSKTVKNVVISSVVPDLAREYVEKSKNNYSIVPFIIDCNNCIINLEVDDASEVGPDRICNVYAAKKLIGFPAIVVDFGSATTYDVINAKGNFIGGAISPGIDVSAHHLIERAALLKSAAFVFPNNVIGKNTTTNLQSGIMYAGVDSVEGMIKRIISEMKINNIHVILTGGFSSLISDKLKINHQLLPNLTLDGMRLIFEHNTKEI